MSIEKLQNAIDMLDDQLIADAVCRAKQAQRRKKSILTAAGLLVVIGIAALILHPRLETRMSSGSNASTTPTSSTIATEPSAENDPIRLFAPPPHMGYAGDPSAINSSGTEAYMRTDGISVTVQAIELLPDTYYDVEDPDTPLRLVRMKTLNVLYGKNMVEEFYYVIQEKYMTDLTKYDALVIACMAQLSCENTVLYNKTAGCYESTELALFGSYYYSTIRNMRITKHIWAFTDGIFDESLWTSAESWENAWEGGFTKIPNWTLEQLETEIIKYYSNDYYQENKLAVSSLKDVQSQDAKEALDYLSSFENGVYAQQIFPWTMDRRPGIDQRFVRYLNGYPTNEYIRVTDIQDFYHFVRYSAESFSESDMQALPNLRAALNSVTESYNEGSIQPPHIQNAADYELYKYAIQGWYVKANDTVYGLIRVDWCFNNPGRANLLDDQYYLITNKSAEPEAIDRDKLVDLLGTDTGFVFLDEYNEYGKVCELYEY